MNPISGLTNKDFNPVGSRKGNAMGVLTATGLNSTDHTKYTRFNSKMGDSGLNFANDGNFRQTSTNAYVGIGIPPISKNYTTDGFTNRPHPMVRAGSQQIPNNRGEADYNSYFRSSAQAMFGSQQLIMPKISTNQVRAKY